MFSETDEEVNGKILALHQKLATELIAASPAHLDEVEIKFTDGVESVGLSVEISENEEDNFFPTHELQQYAQELVDLLKAQNLMFKSAILRAYISDGGSWKYELTEST